ncbi:hypothetical protein F9U64_20980 [Gracilibacillus oryzae]|uniref:Uncharacterized protein n=1 Tax=Gracilibacillus oryzae TaxID=1672701 RepID=A0A7C8GQW8_9BACI|nr:hypothetical protein F9U64_20980 [Gracilibacillus oryzae]
MVMGMAFLATVILWVRYKNNHSGYIWTLLHLMFFSVAVYFLLQAISFDYEHPMASEENSLQIGIAGVVWAVSMICFMIGIYSFQKRSANS